MGIKSLSFLACRHPERVALLSNLLTFRETLILIPSLLAVSFATGSICPIIIRQTIAVRYHDDTSQGMRRVFLCCEEAAADDDALIWFLQS